LKKNLFLSVLILNLLVAYAKAQLMPYGKIDTADLRMTSCDFEKDANAEVLFDHAVVTYNYDAVLMERHKRIKIFNDNGKDEANIRIEFLGVHSNETVSDVEAETININQNVIERTPVDAKLIYTQVIDKYRKAIIFTFANVRAGSVVEFKYKWHTPYSANYPNWFFQTTIPTRYSQFNGGFGQKSAHSTIRKIYQPFTKDTIDEGTNSKRGKHIWALSNVKSYKLEPFMDYPEDYVQSLISTPLNFHEAWPTICNAMLRDEDFGEQLNKSLTNENEFINKANALNTNDEKIAYIFNTVKKSVLWNKTDYWFTVDGVRKAWDKKTGNSTEINLILYHLLRMANVDASLLAVSTREHGKLIRSYPTASALNRTVVYCPVDSSNYYILDASNPYNTYKSIPADLTDLDAVPINPDYRTFKIFRLKRGAASENVIIKGDITKDGNLSGSLQISTSAYSREKYLRKYNDLGETKYIARLEEDDKKFKILSLKMENAENDSVPLLQTAEFNYKLAEPDGDYIYFNPNVLTTFKTNPLINETRVSNIDFGAFYTYSVEGRYKIPKEYRVDVLPKSAIMQMPDKGITFKRVTVQQDGGLGIRYIIDYKKSFYSAEDYPLLFDFYKKMYEMLNEQIVLKKI
jgi:hypothetical protein